MKKYPSPLESELLPTFGKTIYINVNQLEAGHYTLFILYRKKVIATVRFEKKDG